MKCLKSKIITLKSLKKHKGNRASNQCRNVINCHILNYLNKNDYQTSEVVLVRGVEITTNIIAVAKNGSKEIIEVKGYSTVYNIIEEMKEVLNKINLKKPVWHRFFELILNSLKTFENYFMGEKVTLAIGLPDMRRYRQIIENIQEYFNQNNIKLKIYLVAEDGAVKVL